jgi:hypothetical protein
MKHRILHVGMMKFQKHIPNIFLKVTNLAVESLAVSPFFLGTLSSFCISPHKHGSSEKYMCGILMEEITSTITPPT